MIEINLLPKELRRRKIELPSISFLPIFVIILAVHLLLGLSINIKAKTLEKLEKKWQELAPDKEKSDKLKDELTKMRKRIDAIDNLIQGRMSWAKKLSDLSDSIMSGVWLNRLWLEQKIILQKVEAPKTAEGEPQVAPPPKKIVTVTLHLDGSVIAQGGEETAAIGKFIKSLKNNPGFSSDFKEIEATSIQQSHLKDVELMDFELMCYFK